MSLASIDLEALRSKLRRAAQSEMPIVDALRDEVRRLDIRPIQESRVPTIAAVATDGGQNHLILDPLHVEILRVVDSNGAEHLLEVLPLTKDPTDLVESVTAIPAMKRLMDRVDMPYDRLSPFLPRPGVDPRPDHLQTLRDLVEWAVVLDMAWDPHLNDRLILRDGLLRTLRFGEAARSRLSASFEEAFRATGRLLVGVAKRSQVLNYLSLALALEQPFTLIGPCYTPVPFHLEQAAFRRYPEWADRQLGRMHLAKLGPHPDSPIYPVDIPHWLIDQTATVFEHVAATAVDSFPVVGYPEPLIRAHEHAVIHGLELEVLADQLLDAIAEGFTTQESEEVIAHITLGRALQSGGWK